jgi:hypothetical protein
LCLETTLKKELVFNKCFWKNWIPHVEDKLNSCVSLCIKINSKWIKDFNIRPEDLKLLEENKKHFKISEEAMTF